VHTRFKNTEIKSNEHFLQIVDQICSRSCMYCWEQCKDTVKFPQPNSRNFNRSKTQCVLSSHEMRAPFSCGHIYGHLLVWSVLAETSKRDPVPQKTTTTFWWLFCKLLQTCRSKNKSRNPHCRVTFHRIQAHQIRFATENYHFWIAKSWSLVFSCKTYFRAF